MKRTRLAAIAAFAFTVALATTPSRAIEVAAYTPDPSSLPTRQPAAAPLRVAEALSLAPLAVLEPARTGAAADLAALAVWNASGGKPTRVGFARALAEPLALRYDATRFAARIGRRAGGGVVARMTNGDWVWGTSVEVAAAKGLRLELAEVNLPAGTRLWTYALGGEARAFDLRLLRGDGTLISPPVSGDRIYLEVELPAGSIAAGQGFRIRRVHELLIDFVGESTAKPSIPRADSCLQNGECFDAGDFPGIANARNGVFQYLFDDGGLTYTCSGALIGDNDPTTLQPWLLTAHHCLGSQDSALSLAARFFFRYSSCGSGSGSYAPGPLGADLVATSPTTDVTLARAVDAGDIPAGATYLAWTSVRPPDGTILHRLSHPVLDSNSTIQPQVYSTHQLDQTPAIDCFATGAPLSDFLYSLNLAGTGISGGSSGSPVMRGDGVIVGQLFGSCGTLPSRDGCGTDESIIDGAFATSYPLLAPYLTPGAGGLCIRDADTACLLNGRFKVEVTYQTASSGGNAQVMFFNAERAESVESAFFWFFSPTNFEMGVKMVDACVAPYNRYWVFFSGLTSQGFQVTVTRMSDGFVKVYPANPIDNLPTTVADTDAFPCP